MLQGQNDITTRGYRSADLLHTAQEVLFVLACELSPAPAEYPASAHPEEECPALPALSKKRPSARTSKKAGGDLLESMLTIPPEPCTLPPVAVPLSPDEAFPPVVPLPPTAHPAVDPPPSPALLELMFMSVGMPPLSPESTLPPSTAPALPVCAFPPVVCESSRRLPLE